MTLRSDARAIGGILAFFMLFIISFNILERGNSRSRSIASHHVVMLVNSAGKGKKEKKRCDHFIHTSIPDLNASLGVNLRTKLKSKKYKHKSDVIFLVHAYERRDKYVFHCPEGLSIEDFNDKAVSFYAEHGIEVSFYPDYKISLLNSSKNSLKNPIFGFEKECITIDELREHGTRSASDFTDLIINETNLNKKKRLQELQEMWPSVNWHLKILPVGVLPDDKKIPRNCLPLSWLFSAWDLAPKQGEGVVIAVVDTGSPLFNLEKFGYRKHPNLHSNLDIVDYGFNLVSEEGMDPLHQLAILIKSYCKEDVTVEIIESGLLEMVLRFLEKQNADEFSSFLLKNGALLQSDSGQLNSKGKDALQNILYGQHGILPKKSKGYFSLELLQGKNVIAETLPSPLVHSGMNFMATHGASTQGIINAQSLFDGDITGIAPKANVYMIKALEDDGTTTKENLDRALSLAKKRINPDLVNLSLKYGETFDPNDNDDLLMKDLIDSFDYVVIASGNNGDPRISGYVGKKEAYPARFESVAFDVGGFKLNDGKYSYGEFSQYEPDVGPKFLAPGFDIFTSAINPNNGLMTNMFLAGTSSATPVITGCIALVLGEFQEVFSRETLLKVLYKSALRMNGTNKWSDNVGLGMIDVRSALLCLHVLQEIQKEPFFEFENQLNGLIDKIFEIIFTSSNAFDSESKNTQIRSNLSGFLETVSDRSDPSLNKEVEIQIENIDSVGSAINIIIEKLKNFSGNLKMSEDDFLRSLSRNEKIIDRLKVVLKIK